MKYQLRVKLKEFEAALAEYDALLSTITHGTKQYKWPSPEYMAINDKANALSDKWGFRHFGNYLFDRHHFRCTLKAHLNGKIHAYRMYPQCRYDRASDQARANHIKYELKEKKYAKTIQTLEEQARFLGPLLKGFQ